MSNTTRETLIHDKKQRPWLLMVIFITGLALRLYGINWGMPHFFHPDERQIMMQVGELSWKEPNPHFFAYGSFPLYLLKGVVVSLDQFNQSVNSISRSLNLPDGIQSTIRLFFTPVDHFRGNTITGRALSALCSTWNILIVFSITCLVYQRKTAYLASAFFAFTVLSIQQAHFYIVDTPQTLLISLAMLYIIRVGMFNRKRDYYYGAFWIGLAMATKVSSAPIYLAYFFAQFWPFSASQKNWKTWIHWSIGVIASFGVMTAAMPYWILSHAEWLRDVTVQSNMVSGKIGFPYTIQYEHTAPFIYLMNNMVCWSMGLPLGLTAMLGLGYAIYRFFKQSDDIANRLMLCFVVPVFIINSIFKVKFLRYTLPLMPLLTILAAKLLFDLYTQKRKIARPLIFASVAGTMIWALAFVNIYNFKDTRIQASEWVYSNIPKGATVIIESQWDDTLPIDVDGKNANNFKYKTEKLEIYQEPDNERKAEEMASKLEAGDVIILASKRHYGSTLRVPKRYPIAGNFYRSLFAEKLGYKFVKSFEVPPQLGKLMFRDELADESFSVYEHPKVVIFQKETILSKSQILPYLVCPPDEIKKTSYNDILTARPPAAVGSPVEFPIIRWVLAIEILGLIFFPFVFIIFNNFEHKGYPLAKVCGLLVTAYVMWLLAHFKWLPFFQSSILFVIAVLLIINLGILLARREQITTFFRERWWSAAGYEILFLAVFTIFGLLRSYNPNIYWSESSMDFGFLNAILRSEFFPPHDPWITNQAINYYYYGHYLAAFLTKLTGVTAAYGYNLFFASIPAFVAMAIFSIVISLTRRIWAGLMGVVFTVFLGNLDGLVQVSRIAVQTYRNTNWFSLVNGFETFLSYFLVLGRNESHFRFFRSAHELINPTVHEFPYWSYNFMDLHAHTIATLITSFIIALQFVYWRNKKQTNNIFGSGISAILTIIVTLIAFGAAYATNSWDFPTQCIIVFFILNLVRDHSEKSPVVISRLKENQEDKPALIESVPEVPQMDAAAVPERSSDPLQTLEKPLVDEVSEISVEPSVAPILETPLAQVKELTEAEYADMAPGKSEINSLDTISAESVETTQLPVEDQASTTPEQPEPQMAADARPESGPGVMQGVISFISGSYHEIASRLSYNTIHLIFPLMIIIAGSFFFYWPFLSYFTREGMGIGFVHKYKQTTPLNGFVTMFGLFLFVFVTQLISWWISIRLRKGQRMNRILLTGLSWLLLMTAFFLAGVFILEINYSVLGLCLFLAGIIFAIYLKSKGDDNAQFALLMAFMAVVIPAGCELIFIKDFYQGGDHRRFNTIFKFYMQSWFFMSIASAFLLAQHHRIRALVGLNPFWKRIRRMGRWIWSIGFILVFAGSLVFTFQGPQARRKFDEYAKTSLPLTMDGMAYMKTSTLKDGHSFDLNHFTYRAIHWMNQNIKGAPAILEASGADYLYSYGRISGNTGLPTVLGWWSHVDQREYKTDTGRMKSEIREMYESLDVPRVLSLLRKYGIRYIYVGNTEKRDYSEIGLLKFADLTDYMTPVYANPEVTIYQVNDYGLNVDFAKVAADSDALKNLQERIQQQEEQEKEDRLKQEELKRQAIQNAPPASMFTGGEGEARGQFQEPRSLAVDTDGTVYVADFRNHRVQKFESSGNWIKSWGTSGDLPGMFKDICDVAVDADGVYVVDTFNNRVQRFTKTGEFVSIFNDIPGGFFYPRGIAADGKGNLLVSDTGHSRLILMKNDGSFIKEIGRSGKQNGEFSDPVGICFSGERIYVADSKNKKIQILDSSGTFLSSIAVKGWEGDVFVEPYITVDRKGNIWISDPTENRLIVYNPAGELLKTVTQIDGTPMAHPMGLKTTPQGSILVVDTHHHRILELKND